MIRRLSLLVLVAGAMVFPATAAAGGGCLPDDELELTSSSRRTVGISECAFVDTVTYVDPGETVRWVNKDHLPHTVTGDALSFCSEDILDQGGAVSHTFEGEGVYPYYCALHPAMVGAVVVGEAAAGPASAAAPLSSDDGTSAVVVALAAAAGLAALAVATRTALAHRSGAAAS